MPQFAQATRAARNGIQTPRPPTLPVLAAQPKLHADKKQVLRVSGKNQGPHHRAGGATTPRAGRRPANQPRGRTAQPLGHALIQEQLAAFVAAAQCDTKLHDGHSMPRLQQLAHKWSHYANAEAQAATLKDVGSAGGLHDAASGLRSTVVATAKALCAAVKRELEPQPHSHGPSCQRAVVAVHTMATLEVYDAQLLAVCDARVLATTAAGSGTAPLDMRSSAQLMSAWTKLQHTPPPDVLLALVNSSAHGMLTMCSAGSDGAAATAATNISSAQPHPRAGRRVRVAAAFRPPMAATSTRAPTSPGVNVLKLQSSARALVALAAATARLMPGCLGPARSGVFVAAKGVGVSSPPHTHLHSAPLPLNAAALLLPCGPSQPTMTTCNDPLLSFWAAARAGGGGDHPAPPPTQHASDCSPVPVDGGAMAAALHTWRQALLHSSLQLLPAISSSGLASLLQSCCRLHLHPPGAWWQHIAQHAAMTMVTNRTHTNHPPSSRAESSEGPIPTPADADTVVTVCEPLAWMHLRSLAAQHGGWGPWQHIGVGFGAIEAGLGGSSAPEMPPPPPAAKEVPAALKQALCALLEPARVSQLRSGQLTPLLWSALLLCGRHGWQQGVSLLSSPTTFPVLKSRRSHRDVVTPHEQAALEALHAHLPLLSPTQLAQAVYVAGLMRVRPYKSWMTMACQQVRRHASAMDCDACMLLLWGLAALHAPPHKLDSPTTAVLAACAARHVPRMSPDEAVRARSCIHRLYRTLSTRALRELDGRLAARASCVVF